MTESNLSRRELLAALSAIAAFKPASAAAQADRRNVQAGWNLRNFDGRSLNGVILLRLFRGYFPLPAHLTLDASAPPFEFVNFDCEYGDDAQDGAVIAGKRSDTRKHALMEWVMKAPAESRLLRYGFVIEHRRHGPPAPGRPDIRSVVISDKTHFVSVIGPVESLWQDMVNAYARLPRVT